MECIRKGSGSEALSEKKAYEPPRAMRLGEMRGGAGACYGPGSGDGESCSGNGNYAEACNSAGNSPA
jgi:hypothetical protein